MKQLILVVDDNLANLKLACDVLACEGYRVLRAENAEQALGVLTESRPDLILIRKLKTVETTKGIIIVALTASAMKGDEARATEAGCDGYITKPVDTRRFPDQVASFLKTAHG